MNILVYPRPRSSESCLRVCPLWGTVLAAEVQGLPARATEFASKFAGSVTRIGGRALLRISPHVYNSVDEMEQVAALVA